MSVLPYSTFQDGAGQYAIEDNGATLFLDGNAWKKIVFGSHATVQLATVLEFDFYSTIEGEGHSIGFYTAANEMNFYIYGVDITSAVCANYICVDNSYEDYVGSWKHYVIPVGRYFQSSAVEGLTFIADDDRTGVDPPNSRYRNVKIYDSLTLEQSKEPSMVPSSEPSLEPSSFPS